MLNASQTYAEQLISCFPQQSFSAEELAQIWSFMELLAEENAHTNLSGVKTEQGMFEVHVLDSLAPLLFADMCGIGGEVLDLGSGCGVPGALLSMVCGQRLRVSSVERQQKKIAFQNRLKKRLQLFNFSPICANFREVEPKHSYDCFIARAVAKTESLLHNAFTALKTGGTAVLWKGEHWEGEWQDCSPKIKSRFVFHGPRRYDFAGTERGGYLLCFQKR